MSKDFAVAAAAESNDFLAALHEEPRPVTVKELHRKLAGQNKLSEALLAERLQELTAAGRVYQFSYGKSNLYWTRSREHYAREVIMQTLAAAPRTQAELLRSVKARLRDLPEERRKQIIRQLKEERQVQELPPLIGSRTKRLSTQAPDPSDYLSDAVEKISRKLKLSRDQVLAAARSLVGAAPLLPIAGQAKTAELEARPPKEDFGQLLLERMVQLKPAVAQGALLLVSELRRSLKAELPDRESFDRAALSLFAAGRVDLTRHHHPSILSPEERAEMVADGEGNYYNGIILRV
jgi:hypothetical protein